MPFQMKIQVQPIEAIKNDQVVAAKLPAGPKSRLKRLFERAKKEKDDVTEGVEPASVCLDKLVVSFMEDTAANEKPYKCCNCFNGNYDDSSDDEFSGDAQPIAAVDASDVLKGLVPCESVTERNLLADASKIVETNKSKIGKGKDSLIKILTENLNALGYDAAICKSKWEKTPSIPAGEYEYIDVIIEGDRFILDVDFRSEFEIARSTKNYRAVLQSLPLMFVGKSDRLSKIVNVVSEAARLSLKKKGLHFPPWRKLEYMKSKWLAPHERMTIKSNGNGKVTDQESGSSNSTLSAPCLISTVNFNGEFSMGGVVPEPEKMTVVVSQWTPPAVKPKSITAGAKIVTGLASVLTEKPPAISPTKF